MNNRWTKEEIFLARRTFAIQDQLAWRKWERIGWGVYASFLVTLLALLILILYG